MSETIIVCILGGIFLLIIFLLELFGKKYDYDIYKNKYEKLVEFYRFVANSKNISSNAEKELVNSYLKYTKQKSEELNDTIDYVSFKNNYL